MLVCLALSSTGAYAQRLSIVDGFLDLTQQALNITFHPQEESTVALKLIRSSDNAVDATVQIEHLTVGTFVVSTQIKSTLEFVRGEKGSEQFLRGKISSRYSLINYKPVHEISGYFRIQKGRLYLESFSWGSFTCNGYIGLSSSHEIDITVEFDEARASDIALFLGCSDEELDVSGVVTGKINISGFLDRAMLKGNLVARDGFIGESEYNIIRLNFEGLYPTLYISDSRFSDAEGLSFNIDGTFNFGEGCDVAKGMAGLKMSPLVYESDDFREWTIRRREEEGSRRLSEFKYRVEKEDKGGLSLQEGTGILGVEGSIKF